MNDPIYKVNPELNTNITLEEIRHIVMKAKRGSACGIDEIPYDVVKNNTVIQVYSNYSNLYFTAVLSLGCDVKQ